MSLSQFSQTDRKLLSCPDLLLCTCTLLYKSEGENADMRGCGIFFLSEEGSAKSMSLVRKLQAKRGGGGRHEQAKSSDTGDSPVSG